MNSEFTIPIKFGPNGCQVNLGDRVCRETETLAIIKEFNRTYQAKLREIEHIGSGDNLQLRVNLQRDWIRDLTQQNEMLVKIVENLEKEAVDKVALLQQKLETTSLTSEKAHKDAAELDYKVKDLERRLSESPNPGDLQALQHKLRLKEEEIDSAKRPKPLEKSNSVVVELTEAAGELGRLRKSLQKVQKQYQDAFAQSEMKDDVIKDMQRNTDELERRHRECLRETERKDNVINQMQVDVEELREKCKGVERELATGKEVIGRLREEAAVREEKCATEAEMIRKLKSEVEKWKRELEEATNECGFKDGIIQKLRERVRLMQIDDENVKISAKQHNVKLQAKTSAKSLKSRPRSAIIGAPGKKSPASSKVPVLRRSAPKRRPPSRSVQVDTRSLTSAARRRAAGKSTRCICVETLAKSVGRKSRPSTRCVCVGPSSSSECPSLSARSRSTNTREPKKSTPSSKSVSKSSPLPSPRPKRALSKYATIYDVPLSPRPLPPPKPSPPPPAVQPNEFIYLYNRTCRQIIGPCSPHFHMSIPNAPKPPPACCTSQSPRKCCQGPPSNLSCNNVLHEHYKISNTSHHSGIIHKFIPISDRPPIRTFINNLELNIRKQNECSHN